MVNPINTTRFRLLSTCLSLLISWPGLNVSAAANKSAGKTYSAEELFKKFKPAVAKIVLRQQRVPVATGTGFFVSADGLFVTNYHVIKSALKTGSFTAEFVLSNGKVIKEFLIANCRDDRAIDLCVLKLPFKPKNWFTPSKYKPSPGETVYTIGHPQGLDFSISNGIVSALRLSPTNVQEVQISAAISPGNSGGPIFNSHGTLLGVASKFFKDGQNLNFGIQTSEVSRYIEQNKKFVSLEQYRKNNESKIASTVKQWTTQEIDPAYATLQSGKTLNTTTNFRDITLDFRDDRFKIPLPKMFDGCKKVETRKRAMAFQCGAMGNTVIFSISRVAAEPDAPLYQLDGKKPLKEKPLPLVEMLMEEGTWTEYEKTLTPLNRKYLYSIPDEAKCRKITGNLTPGAVFTDDSVQCRFSIFNDLEADAYSYSLWVQHGGYIYDFYVWMEDAGYANYFNHVPTIAVLGAHTDMPDENVIRAVASAPGDESTRDSVPPFTVELAAPFALSNTEFLDDGTVSYLYSHSSAQTARNASSIVYMVNVLKQTIPNRDLSERARQLFQGTVEGFGARVDMSSVKTQSLSAAQMPGVIQTGFGKRKDRDLALFHALLLSGKGSFMVFGFCDAKDSAQALRDFQQMTKSLKRR